MNTKKREIGEELSPEIVFAGMKGYPSPERYHLVDAFTEIGDIKKHIKFLEKVIANAKSAGYRRVEVSVESEPEYDYTETTVTVLGFRLETKQEVEARLERRRKRAEAAKKAMKRRKVKREEKDKAEYARLKEKFEGAKK